MDKDQSVEMADEPAYVDALETQSVSSPASSDTSNPGFKSLNVSNSSDTNLSLIKGLECTSVSDVDSSVVDQDNGIGCNQSTNSVHNEAKSPCGSDVTVVSANVTQKNSSNPQTEDNGINIEANCSGNASNNCDTKTDFGVEHSMRAKDTEYATLFNALAAAVNTDVSSNPAESDVLASRVTPQKGK